MNNAGKHMPTFRPRLDILPPPQRALWPELDATPDWLALSGGTALALRIGHRQSVDFDFFSRTPFDPAAVAREIPYLAGAEPVQVVSDTLTCRVERRWIGPGFLLWQSETWRGRAARNCRGIEGVCCVAARCGGDEGADVQQRAQARDYIDIDALIRHGIDLPQVLAAGGAVYGGSFNPLLTLKALSYFDDVPSLSSDVQERLRTAVAAVDPASLPVLTPHARHDNARAP